MHHSSDQPKDLGVPIDAVLRFESLLEKNPKFSRREISPAKKKKIANCLLDQVRKKSMIEPQTNVVKNGAWC